MRITIELVAQRFALDVGHDVIKERGRRTNCSRSPLFAILWYSAAEFLRKYELLSVARHVIVCGPQAQSVAPRTFLEQISGSGLVDVGTHCARAAAVIRSVLTATPTTVSRRIPAAAPYWCGKLTAYCVGSAWSDRGDGSDRGHQPTTGRAAGPRPERVPTANQGRSFFFISVNNRSAPSYRGSTGFTSPSSFRRFFDAPIEGSPVSSS